MKPDPLHPTRRDFISTLALAGAALPLTSRAAEKSASSAKTTLTPALAGPTTVHVFSKPLHMMSHAETAKLIASCGYGGIDYTVRKAQAHVLP